MTALPTLEKDDKSPLRDKHKGNLQTILIQNLLI